MEKNWLIFVIIAALWTIPWKGIALWKSAKNGQKSWFIMLFLINTLAVLEIIYIFFFSQKKTDSAGENTSANDVSLEKQFIPPKKFV
jgi:flagellar basal body-associated protein FliL